MGTENIKNAYKITISRKRTRVTTYENLQLQTTQPIKSDKPKKIKPSIPSNYAEFNYYNRCKKRKETIKEICENNFDIPNVVMITLTFDQANNKELDFTNINIAHNEFKKFMQRMNDHFKDYKYIATFSRQTNGNWHYHIFCNLNESIKNKTIKTIWGMGITYISYIESNSRMKTMVQYLVNNMSESVEDLKGKRGYLTSKGVERNIVVTSYRTEHEAVFVEAFEKVSNCGRTVLYETKHPLGIIGEQVDEETGEIFTVKIPNRELTPGLQEAGYEHWDTVYTHLKSSAKFEDKFSELKPATPRPKKFKRTVKPS